MGSYGYRRGWDWESELAGGMITLALLVAAILITLSVVVTLELGRIYVARALRPSPVQRFLWLALAALLGCWLLAGALVAFPATVALGVYLAAWSFLAFVIGVELADRYAAQFDAPVPGELGLEDVLRPWAHDAAGRAA